MLENLDFFYIEIDYRLTILKIQYGLPIKKSFFTFKKSEKHTFVKQILIPVRNL